MGEDEKTSGMRDEDPVPFHGPQTQDERDAVRSDDPGADHPSVAIPVVPVAAGQPLSEQALRVRALRGRTENQQTILLKVWWQDATGENHGPIELALSIPAAAKLADLLGQAVRPFLRFDPERDERWT